ncbi:hypothetical protein [Actinocrispum wychmicini]|uniref:Uncharacterized protein n=1 Tax=Actinocrispum wychmicini TaxID=1213861 RepID=A0A4R2JEW2_9PSEU|nr:hypothetical protein [Actinocrispum wychmicini]TCO54789.1 hypothetical protein EV192_10877 [Actinocrispum wychmicini]
MAPPDQLQGETDGMKRFEAYVLAQLQEDYTVNLVRRRDALRRTGGMPEWGEMVDADNESTKKMHEFVTHMRQGFAAYSTWVHNTAVAYLAADDDARTAMLASLDVSHREEGLPDIDPSLEPPDTRMPREKGR